MKLAFSLIIVLLFSSEASTQNDRDTALNVRNSFFAEVGGPGIAFSLNIDRRFNNSRFGFGGRAGLGFVTGSNDDFFDYRLTSAITVPVQLNYIFGRESSNHSLEAGAGVTYVSKSMDIMEFFEEKQTQVFGTVSFMYRRQPKDGGFSWRAGFSPLIRNGLIQLFGGASLGYNF